MATIQAPVNTLHDLKQQLHADSDTLDTVVTDMQTFLAIAAPTTAQRNQQIVTLSQDVRQMARIQKRMLRAVRDLIKQVGK